jgi:cytochrome c2
VQNVSQTRRRHGYNLQSEGSKVSPSWLFNWVKDPRQVWAETKMPMLRLTDAEAADVVAYVSSQKNADWEKQAPPQVDPKALDDVVLEFLRAGSTDIEARDKLKTMSLDQKNLYAGEKLVGRYGCFACHNVPGFEKAQPIGTELSEAGSKLIAQLDFGFLSKEMGGPLEHSRADWYRQKLLNPRIFDVGRLKRPEELLKMPNFQLSERDAESITQVLTSLVRDPVPLEMRDRTATAIAEGRALVAEKNCKGCHLIEGAGRDIRGFIGTSPEQQAQWPPNLNTEGFKVQPEWLHSFLDDPGKQRMRVWINARMPTFHFDEREKGILGRYFSALDKVDYPYISTAIADATPEKLKAGSELFVNAKCQSCHPTGSQLPPGRDPSDLAPDLALAHTRLRPDWILKWLEDPQKIAPGTRMPTFFSADDTGARHSPWKDILGGDPKNQIEAIRDHVFITVGGGGGGRKVTSNTTGKAKGN